MTNPWCPEELKNVSRLDAIFLTHAHPDQLGDLPALAMLPIGDRFTAGPREAAYAIRLLGVKHVIPMHYATFPFLTGTVEGLRSESKKIKGLKIYALKAGEKL